MKQYAHKRLVQRLVSVAFLFIGAVLVQILLGSSATQLKEKIVEELYSTHLFTKVHFKLFQEQKMDWELRSQEAESNKKNMWDLTEVEGTFYGSKSTQINLKSPTGRLDTSDLIKVFLYDGVSARSSNGYVFNTEQIAVFRNQEKEKKFTTESPIDLYNRREKLSVQAIGAKGDITTGEVELLSNVQCVKSVQEYENIKITSDRAFIKSSLNSIRFKDNLQITQDKFNIRGEEAYFVYNPASANLKSIKINGNIFASDGEKTAMSQKVEMRPEEDVIIFQGHPRIRMGKNELVGEEILVTNKQKNIQVIRGNIKSTKEGIDINE